MQDEDGAQQRDQRNEHIRLEAIDEFLEHEAIFTPAGDQRWGPGRRRTIDDDPKRGKPEKPGILRVVRVLGLWGVLLLSSVSVRAQPRGTAVRIEGADPNGQWLERARLQGAVQAAELSVPPSTTPLRRVRGLETVEGRLREARDAAGRLDSGAALAHLAAARDLAEQYADVAGASRWLAEVEITLGVVAAQAGMSHLSDVALTRAASLDPTRTLQRAEAAPLVIARAEELREAYAIGPEAHFVVTSDAPGAVVYLDDRVVGSTPATIETRRGRHVLRVEAPGHVGWGRAIDVFGGRRATVHVVVARTGFSRSMLALQRAPTLRQAAELSVGTDVRLWWLEVGDGPRDRALLYRCGSESESSREMSSCGSPLHLEGQRRWPASSERLAWHELREQRRHAWSWLRQNAGTPATPWFRRWYVWMAVAVGLLGAGLGLGLLLRPDAPEQLEVTIDPGAFLPED